MTITELIELHFNEKQLITYVATYNAVLLCMDITVLCIMCNNVRNINKMDITIIEVHIMLFMHTCHF